VTVPDAILDTAGLQSLLRTAFPGSEVSEIVEVTADGVTVRIPISEKNSRPGGTVSGPTIMALVDTAAYVAILSRVGPELLTVTTSLHIDFLRKPPIADLIADGHIVKLGRRLAVVDVTVRSVGRDDPVAKSLVTYARDLS
jgi:uncharacterized protein (TIGR00369 family)